MDKQNLLCLDVGNSQIHAGLFVGDSLSHQFRFTSKTGASADEIGIFLRNVLRENGVAHQEIQAMAICSVVPDMDSSLRACAEKYFGVNPFFIQPGVKTGLKIRYYNPAEVGADRIANAIAAVHLFPDQNVIVVDLGTATTFCAISREQEYLGGAITAGFRISMEALVGRTAKLPAVELIRPNHVVGRSTVESIQNGLYYSVLGSIRELCGQISREVFGGERPIIIGTGGLASLFSEEKIFDREIPDLVLRGLLTAYRLRGNQR